MVWLGEPSPPKPHGRKRPATATKLAQEQADRQAIRKAAASLLADTGAGVTRRQISEATGQSKRRVERLYPSDEDLRGDVLTEHIKGLVEAISGAMDRGKDADPAGQLDSVTKAWVDFVAEEPNEHRAFLSCEPTLHEPYRTEVRSTYRQVLSIVCHAICAAIPGLGDMVEGLLGPAAAAMLSNVALGSPVPGAQARQKGARRVTRTLMMAGVTDISGGWIRLLPGPEERAAKPREPQGMDAILTSSPPPGRRMKRSRRRSRSARSLGTDED